MHSLGKTLIIIGIILIIAGSIAQVLPRISKIPRLPGDIYIKKGNFTFYFPLTSCIILSIVFSLVFWLWSKR
ncbi:MAG: DUF2905 domain-containing protein [Candidatus Omnitrophica bacterium]|nr:DUF2905 domain-containing protein [Candidatus Omnitrophota bacterium]